MWCARCLVSVSSSCYMPASPLFEVLLGMEALLHVKMQALRSTWGAPSVRCLLGLKS